MFFLSVNEGNCLILRLLRKEDDLHYSAERFINMTINLYEQ